MTRTRSDQANRTAILMAKRQDKEFAAIDTDHSAPETRADSANAIRVRRMMLPDLRLMASRLEAAYLDQPMVETDRAGVFLTGARSMRPLDKTRPQTHLAFTAADEF